ncbi:hypothetical protein ASG73_03435 [Janibacter sp. Soil728]|nr:hypothetical protein ASG73_03435 [Janibacter sp. Soil728]
MVEITGTAQREAWREGVLPPVEEVRPGLWSIPVPIPDSPLRYVLIHLLAHEHGLLVLDAGWDHEDAWTALTQGIIGTGHALTDVSGIVVTHMHPDHFGLAPRLREESDAWIGMHPADAALVLEQNPEQVAAARADAVAQLVAAGAPDALLVGAGTIAMERLPLDHGVDRELLDGDTLRIVGSELTVVHTPGHTPGHICLFDDRRRLFFSGDHVLPRISPHIAVIPGQQIDPLGEYLASLRKVAAFDPDEVLPAHEYRFRGLGSRARELVGHHEERLDELLAAIRSLPAPTANEVCDQLTWSRPILTMAPHLRRMALRETIAHLVVLERRDLVRARPGVPERWFPTSAGESTPEPIHLEAGAPR